MRKLICAFVVTLMLALPMAHVVHANDPPLPDAPPSDPPGGEWMPHDWIAFYILSRYYLLALCTSWPSAPYNGTGAAAPSGGILP